MLVSEKYGFTKLSKVEYQELKKEGRLIPDGANVKIFTPKGRVERIRRML